MALKNYKILGFLISVLVSLFLYTEANAASRYVYVTLEPFEYHIIHEEKDPLDPPHRLPGLYYWEKTESGQIYCDVQKPIFQYEIWDNEETCLCRFEDEESLVKFLYFLNGTYTLRLISEDVIYIGLIKIS